MNQVAVFCGASAGTDTLYVQTGVQLGRELALRNIGIVYGGAKIGVMGAVADGALQAGGKVIGVIPHFLRTREVAHDTLTQLILVDSMHERKTRMHDLSDGFIALPGGFGTMEELFEILTWGQLGLHTKPIGLLNVNGFYDPLIAMARQMLDRGFLRQTHFDMLLTSDSISDLLLKMESYRAPDLPQWITTQTT